MDKHTPWIVSDEREIDGNIYVEDQLGVVAIVTSQEHARLIAAAPELLEMLQKAVKFGGLFPDLAEEARAVIAKATGE